jgi:hypothetical protein
VTPTRWAYEVNVLQEAKERRSTFKSALEEKLLECQNAVTRCQTASDPRRPAAAAASPQPQTAVELQSDVAAGAFPLAEGRSSLARSFQVLGTFFTVFVILILSTLSLKGQR